MCMTKILSGLKRCSIDEWYLCTTLKIIKVSGWCTVYVMLQYNPLNLSWYVHSSTILSAMADSSELPFTPDHGC